MSKIFLINAHHKYPFSEGRLNQTLLETAKEMFLAKGHEVKLTNTDDEWSADQELEKHIWCDTIFLQTPVNWMMPPWTFKKYMDDVYTAGMSGPLCKGDGRTREAPKKNYGAGGTLTGKKYMLSLTFNAPKESFDDPDEYLFQGKGVDDLWMPMHMNFRFFGMESLPTFVCYDVMKNADIEGDFKRFKSHLNEYF